MVAALRRDYPTLIGPPPAAGEVRLDAWPVAVDDPVVMYLDVSVDGMTEALAVVPGTIFRVEMVEDPNWFYQLNAEDVATVVGSYVELPATITAIGAEAPEGLVDVWLGTKDPTEPEVPELPAYDLGPTDTFASALELAGYLGGTVGNAGDTRRNLALLEATRWVAYRIGLTFADEAIPPGPVTITPVAARPAWRAATLVAATRFMRSSDAVFGAMGGFGDDAVYVTAKIPEAELHLMGQTVSFGIA